MTLREDSTSLDRRSFIKKAIAGSGLATIALAGGCASRKDDTSKASVFIANVRGYNDNIRQHILSGFQELGLTRHYIAGKKVLLKPNLVEPHLGIGPTNTHPLVIRGTIEVFLQLGADSVIVAEGAGHRRDSLIVLEESGVADVLVEDKIPFSDLNTGDVFVTRNLGTQTKLRAFALPEELRRAEIIVSMAKMKTHHWAGVTLSMKNLFGILPGSYYGWPKNVLHVAGVQESILDINTTVVPQLAIVDGIVGMEGDGPIRGTPIQSNCLVMGYNLPAVDATCARIMGIDPYKIKYLASTEPRLGVIKEDLIQQKGETIMSVQKNFKLIETIQAHQNIRLSA